MGTVAEALARLGERRAILVGDFMLDAYIYGETVRISREAPVPVVRREHTEHRLGGAANTAANLRALGLGVELVGGVGADESGDLLRGMLEGTGAITEHLLEAQRTTPLKTRVMAGAHGTARQQVLRLDDEPERPLDEQLEAKLSQRVRDAARGADVILVSDYGTGGVGDYLRGAVKDLAQDGARVCVDSRRHLLEYEGVTAITPNLPEAQAAAGFALDHRDAIDHAGAALVKKLSLQACLLTQGRGGMTLYQPSGSSHADIVGEGEVTDVTGAGDTVLATFGGALAAGLGFTNAMRLANCAAGVVVTKGGAATASPDEIIALAGEHGVELEPWDK